MSPKKPQVYLKFTAECLHGFTAERLHGWEFCLYKELTTTETCDRSELELG